MHLRGQALIVCLINLEYVDGQICPVFEIKWLNIMTDHFDDSSHLICKILQLINKT